MNYIFYIYKYNYKILEKLLAITNAHVTQK